MDVVCVAAAKVLRQDVKDLVGIDGIFCSQLVAQKL
jgi:hypothetical protein